MINQKTLTTSNNRLATSSRIAGFVQGFLLNRYDSPVPIPAFHREIWDLISSGAKRIAIAAPRNHAKSTAVTHAVTLYMFLFRICKYGIIISDTESQASQFLGDIKNELMSNPDIRDTFRVKRIVKDAITDIIIEMDDGHKFRIQALGAEQKVRGRKWNNSRPDFIVGDDLENDEMVESDDRRDKSNTWFFKALLPSMSKNGIIIIVGTILHQASILNRLIRNKSWTSLLYRAHDGFDDFSNLLWPEQWSELRLRETRQEYMDAGYAEGYAQEYLNDPSAHSEAFFKKEDFLEIEEEMHNLNTINYAAVDLAISDADRAAYTVIVLGGMDSYRRLLIKKVVRFRGDSNDIINTMLSLQQVHDIQMWKMEQGQIKLTLMGELYNRMNSSGVYLNIVPGVPTKDKRSRARAIQARMRAGGVYFDKQADWYPSFEQELLQFPKGMYKDQVDAIAWLGIAINELSEANTTEEDEEDNYMQMKEESMSSMGVNPTTGY